MQQELYYFVCIAINLIIKDMTRESRLEWSEEDQSVIVTVNENELPICKHMFEESIQGNKKFYLCIMCGKSYYEKIT